MTEPGTSPYSIHPRRCIRNDKSELRSLRRQSVRLNLHHEQPQRLQTVAASNSVDDTYDMDLMWNTK